MNGRQRVIPNPLGTVTSVDQCKSLAQTGGYNVIGVQTITKGLQCWAGTNIDYGLPPDAGGPREATGCPGIFKNQVYTLDTYSMPVQDTPSTVTAPPPPVQDTPSTVTAPPPPVVVNTSKDYKLIPDTDCTGTYTNLGYIGVNTVQQASDICKVTNLCDGFAQNAGGGTWLLGNTTEAPMVLGQPNPNNYGTSRPGYKCYVTPGPVFEKILNVKCGTDIIGDSGSFVDLDNGLYMCGRDPYCAGVSGLQGEDVTDVGQYMDVSNKTPSSGYVCYVNKSAKPPPSYSVLPDTDCYDAAHDTSPGHPEFNYWPTTTNSVKQMSYLCDNMEGCKGFTQYSSAQGYRLLTDTVTHHHQSGAKCFVKPS